MPRQPAKQADGRLNLGLNLNLNNDKVQAL
jgi:hypothetical protein